MARERNIENYTKYCLSEEGKEYLRKMLMESNNNEPEEKTVSDCCGFPVDSSDLCTKCGELCTGIELDIDEEIDFENLRIFDESDEDDFDEDVSDDEIDIHDDFFRINETNNDDEYDYWKETQ